MANEQLIEEAADQIEDVAVKIEEVADATRRLTGREFGFFFAGIGVGVAAGFAAGYFIAEHRLKTKYSKLANDEISNIREHYYKKEIARQRKPPVDQVVVVEEERNEHGYTQKEQEAIDEVNRLYPADEEKVEERVEIKETASQVNVFKEYAATDEWDYEVELRRRSKDVPYIIHVDEFRQNEPSHDQVTYTYYEVDDILANTRNMRIEDMDEAIGLGNLGRWGHGSKDENIVYIRNEEMGMDFEILRDRGSYADTISGTIRHSSEVRRRRPNRRFDDD